MGGEGGSAYPNAIWCDMQFYTHLCFQHIAFLLCQDGHFWGGGGLHILSWGKTLQRPGTWATDTKYMNLLMSNCAEVGQLCGCRYLHTKSHLSIYFHQISTSQNSDIYQCPSTMSADIDRSKKPAWSGEGWTQIMLLWENHDRTIRPRIIRPKWSPKG